MATIYNLSHFGEKILWVDTETTGTDLVQDDVIELAAILETAEQDPVEFSRDQQTVAISRTQFVTLIQPCPARLSDAASWEKARQVSGITLDQLSHADIGREAIDRLCLWLEEHAGVSRFDKEDKVVLAGYNVRFDADIMRNWWRRNARQKNFYGSWFWPYTLDVLQYVSLLVALLPKEDRSRPESFRLGDVAKWLGIEPQGELHSALADIDLTRQVFSEVLLRLGSLNLVHHELPQRIRRLAPLPSDSTQASLWGGN